MKRFVALTLLLALAACAPSTAIQSLRRILTVAQIAAPAVMSYAGTPAATQETILRYLASVAAATRQASVILLDAGTDAEKGARIVEAYAGALRPVLPPGTPQEVVGLVLGVSDAVAAFLANYGEWNTKSRLVEARTTPLSGRDRDELVKILQSAGMLEAYVNGEKARIPLASAR